MSNPLAEGIPVPRPDHAEAPLDLRPARILATWPVGTFVENLLAQPDGSFLVAVHSTNSLETVWPDGRCEVTSILPASGAGLARCGGSIYVNTGTPGQTPGRILRLLPDGRTEVAVEIPHALFLNGLTPFPGDRMLAVDSILGCVFLVDPAAGTCELWLADEMLRKCSPEPMLPGVNGVKLFGDWAYFSTTERSLITRAPIRGDGSAGELEIVASRLLADDFAFDRAGNLYLTTHVHNTVLRLSPDGARSVLGGVEQGLAGCTACAFGVTADDDDALYVTTTGGILSPAGGRVQEAKLLRLEIGQVGYRF